MGKTIELETGLAAGGRHLKLMSKTTQVEITRGQLIDVTVYLVAVIDFHFMTKVYFNKSLDQIFQFDTEVKARRKFDRLNQIGK